MLGKPKLFNEELAAKLQQLAKELETKSGEKSPPHRSEAAERKHQLWSPLGDALRRSALKHRDGTVATDQQKITDELVAAWVPKFSKVDVGVE